MAVDTTTPLVSRAGRLSDAVARVQSRQQVGVVHAGIVSPLIVKESAPVAPPITIPAPQPAQSEPTKMRFWPGFWLFILGGVLASTALFTYAWLAAGPAG